MRPMYLSPTVELYLSIWHSVPPPHPHPVDHTLVMAPQYGIADRLQALAGTVPI